MQPIIEAIGLSKHFTVTSGGLGLRGGGTLRAVDDVNLAVGRGECFALVGESGCGKTTLGRMLLGLIRPTSGRVRLKGRDLTRTPQGVIRKSLQIVFQDPLSSLNPRKSVRDIIGRPLQIHKLAIGDLDDQVRTLLSLVHLDGESLDRYPHEFSGGQQQRIAIARALATQPDVVVADEPVSSLDVSVQAQIISLLSELQSTMALTLVLISHDLALVKYMADRVAIMYMGKIVEHANAEDIFGRPLHPYTIGLLSSTGIPDPALRGKRKPIRGDLPSPVHPPPGCLFQTRCQERVAICSKLAPSVTEVETSHWVACHEWARSLGNAKL